MMRGSPEPVRNNYHQSLLWPRPEAQPGGERGFCGMWCPLLDSALLDHGAQSAGTSLPLLRTGDLSFTQRGNVIHFIEGMINC